MITKIYSEDDWKALVEVIADESDDKYERFQLRVIRTIQESRMYKPTPNNTVFKAEKLKGPAWLGMWHLREANASS